MAIEYLTFQQFSDIITSKMLQEIPTIDPTIFGSWQRGFTVGNAALAESLTINLRDLEKQLFPQTATGEFLDRWGTYEDLERPAATQAQGDINVGGTLTINIPIGTLFNNANGFQYEATATSTIIDNVGVITQIVRSGSLATVTTLEDHGLVSGTATIIGANEAEYNGVQEITTTERNRFTYTVSGSPSTPATGTITFSSVHASVNIQSVDSGAGTNVAKDSVFTIDDSTPVVGANSTGSAQFDGISGGADEADDETYRQLILASRASRAGVFTEDAIKISVLSISGNTRVFVKRPTSSGAGGAIDPEPGEVSVYFLRDNDANIIPTPTIIATTKEKIILDGGLPANTPDQYVYVQGPTPIGIDVTFSGIVPDSPTMRTAIQASINAFFVDDVDFEETVRLDALRGAISQTVDAENNQALTSFSITSPVSDVVIAAGQIGVAGDVTF